MNLNIFFPACDNRQGSGDWPGYQSGEKSQLCEVEAFSLEDDESNLLAKMSSSVAMVDMPEGWVRKTEAEGISTRRHPDRSVKPDCVSIQHFIFSNMAHKSGKLFWLSQPSGERDLCR